LRTRTWPPEQFAALVPANRQASDGWRIALLGGPDERLVMADIKAQCPNAVDTGCDHSELEFAALVARCQAIVTGDTMALHVALAMDVPTIALFGPTCPQEIDLFGRGEHIVTGLSCGPCYRRSCDITPSCMDDIDVARVHTAVLRWAAAAPARAMPLPQAVGISV
jgi:ADP-heptose:LPS heptosyltransferase